MKRYRVALATIAVVAGLPAAAAVGPADAQTKVWLCHATGSEDNPYTVTHVSPNAVFKDNGGHFYEDGTPQAGHEDDRVFDEEPTEEQCPTERPLELITAPGLYMVDPCGAGNATYRMDLIPDGPYTAALNPDGSVTFTADAGYGFYFDGAPTFTSVPPPEANVDECATYTLSAVCTSVNAETGQGSAWVTNDANQGATVGGVYIAAGTSLDVAATGNPAVLDVLWDDGEVGTLTVDGDCTYTPPPTTAPPTIPPTVPPTVPPTAPPTTPTVPTTVPTTTIVDPTVPTTVPATDPPVTDPPTTEAPTTTVVAPFDPEAELLPQTR